MADREPTFDLDPEQRFGWSFYERLERLGLAVFVLSGGEIVLHDGAAEILRLDAEEAERLAHALTHAAEYVADEFVDADDEAEVAGR